MTRTRRLLTLSLRSGTSVIVVLAGLIAINVVVATLPLRWDLTADRLYTLSEGTETLLENLGAAVTIKYYASQNLPDAPEPIKRYQQKVEELLREYVALGDGKLRLEVFDPKPDTEDEEWALRYGIRSIDLNRGSRLFFGVVFLQEDRETTLPFIDPRRERFLEYDVSEALVRVQRRELPKVGVISGLPVFGGPPTAPGGQGTPPSSLIEELRKNYIVEDLTAAATAQVEAEDVDREPVLPEDLSLLFLIHPRDVNDAARYEIDQYLLRGNHLVVFLDPYARTDPLSRLGFQQRTEPKSDLPAFLRAWGVDYSPGQVVADQALATDVRLAQNRTVPFPLWLTLRSNEIDDDSVITDNLDEITLVDAGSFALRETDEDASGPTPPGEEPPPASNLEFVPLLRTTAEARNVDSYLARVSQPDDILKSIKGEGKQRTLAALLNGEFESAFNERAAFLQGEGASGGERSGGERADEALPEGHLARSSEKGAVLLIADADFISDQFSVRRLNFFGQTVLRPLNDNLNFVLNAVEFMVGNQALISVRSRGNFSRPFTRVRNLQVTAQQRYQEQEQALQDELRKVRADLRKLEEQEGQDGEGERIISQAMLNEIKRFRVQEQQTQRALREVRKVLRQDIESLGNRLLVLNLLLVPLLVALLGFFVIGRRAKRQGGTA